MDPTRIRKELDIAKSGLCFMQVVYKPQDQLSRTKRLEGAYELHEDEPKSLQHSTIDLLGDSPLDILPNFIR
jgi:hypothetical protein